MTIGVYRKYRIGDRIPRIWVDGRLIDQPCVVLADSTYEAWVDSVREFGDGRDPYDWEIAIAKRDDVWFYRVSTD